MKSKRPFTYERGAEKNIGCSVTFSQFKNKTHYLGSFILEKIIF